MRFTKSLFAHSGHFSVRRLTGFFTALSLIFPTANMALDVPLTLKENADAGIGAFPISAVVPLQQGAFTNPQTLSIQDRPSQTQALERWPNGSLRHVLVHFQDGIASHQTKTVHLINRAPLPPAKPVTLQETLASITVLKFLTSIQPYHNISNHEYVPILVKTY